MYFLQDMVSVFQGEKEVHPFPLDRLFEVEQSSCYRNLRKANLGDSGSRVDLEGGGSGLVDFFLK